MENKKPLSLVWQVVRHRKRFIAALMLVILLSLFFESLSFAIIVPFFEVFLDTRSSSELSSIVRTFFSVIGVEVTIPNVCVTFFVMILFKNLLIISREAMRSKFANEFKRDWMDLIFKKYLSMDYQSYMHQKTGNMSDVIVSETIKASTGLLQLAEFITGILTIPVFLGLLILANPKVTMIALVVGGGVLFTLKKYLEIHAKRVGDKELQLRQQISADVVEVLTGMKHVRTFSLERVMSKKLYEKFREQARIIVNWDIFTASTSPFVEILLVLGVTIYLYQVSSVGGVEGFKKVLPTMSMMVIVAHKTMGLLTRVFVTRMVVFRYLPSFKIISDNTLNVSSEWNEEPTSLVIPFKNNIELKNVSFAYGDSNVLSNASMTIEKGSRVALIGGSGAGKSTIANLFLRFFNPTSGGIFVDGVNIIDYPLSVWRSKVGYVSQDNFLFNDTIYNNILVGKPDATIDEVRDVCRRVGALDFIENELDDKFETIVGEQGAKLSGGQRQRVIIARSLIRKPMLLILDEATSSLDHSTEESINKEVVEKLVGLTILIITHREAVLKYVDKIFKIESGRISFFEGKS